MSCSFCRSHWHNVTLCSDQRLVEYYNKIMEQYKNVIRENSLGNNSRHKLQFYARVNRQFTLREVRSVLARYTNIATSRFKKASLISMLFEYFENTINSSQIIEEHIESTIRLPTQPDPIPSFARDLEEHPEEEEPDITWYMDTSRQSLIVPQIVYTQDEPEEPVNYENIRQFMGSSPLVNRRLFGSAQITTVNQNNAEDETIHMIHMNLLQHFNDVDGNIPFNQVKKYNISLLLVSNEIDEECKEDCVICYNEIKCMDMVTLNCDHRFCGVCINETLKSHKSMYSSPCCALCRKQMTNFTVNNQETVNLISSYCKYIL